MKALRVIGQWLDQHLLFVTTLFLMAFIPLYPKIPLWSPIEQYIVRVRLEDFFILFAGIVWLVQVIRGKIKWLSPMFWLVLAYVMVGAASTLSAIYYTQTVPMESLHIGKTLLHYFRYIEYFSLFFIAYGAVRKRQDVKWLMAFLALTVVAITLYGYGQKFFYWPVYSTMNREFSKGIRLYLTPFARVQSTFAGHYDMAAYLVVTLPIILALAYQSINKWLKLGLHVSFWLGSWLLVLSASRTPFGAYLVGVALVITLTALVQKGWLNKARFWFGRGIVTALMVLVLLFYFGADLFERLGHIINANPSLAKMSQEVNTFRLRYISDETLAALPLTPAALQKMLPQTEPPLSGISTDELAAAAAKEVAATKDVASSKDQQPVAAGDHPDATPIVPPIFKASDPTDMLPAGVYKDIPDEVEVITTSPTGEKVVQRVQRKRIYSECALKNELSLCIRLETLWPRAIEGFLMNPVLGSGYATLTKDGVEVFTEADSTDNNFLRTLGETGILGVVTFYGCVLLVLWQCLRSLKSTDPLLKAVGIGLFGGTIGLLLNAIYIDVFAASKVAQTYWLICGVFLAYAWVVAPAAVHPALPVVEDMPIKLGQPQRLRQTKRSKQPTRRTAQTRARKA